MRRRSIHLLTAIGLALLAAPAAAETTPVFDEDDAAMIEESAQDSMEYDETFETSEWVNPDTGNSGTITPTQNFETDDGTYCREYHQTVTIGGKEEEAYGTACRTEDGSWEIARAEPDVRNVTQSDTQSDEPDVAADDPPDVVYRDRVVYVPEPRPAYYYPWYYPFAVSFGIGLHDGHFGYYGGHRHYRGHRYPYRQRVHGHGGHSHGVKIRRGHHRRAHHRRSHLRY
jgi:surface antigen